MNHNQKLAVKYFKKQHSYMKLVSYHAEAIEGTGAYCCMMTFGGSWFNTYIYVFVVGKRGAVRNVKEIH